VIAFPKTSAPSAADAGAVRRDERQLRELHIRIRAG